MFKTMSHLHLNKLLPALAFSINVSDIWVINSHLASFSTTRRVLRSYEIWTALCTQKGFQPQEVLKATSIGPYVVVDPDDPDTLLALSAVAFQKLKGQCVSNEKSLVLLLSPLDERTPNRPTSADSNQNSPNPDSQKKSKVRGFKSMGRRWFVGLYDPSWSFIGGRLDLFRLQDHGFNRDLFLEINQRWLTKLAFWLGRPHIRRDGSASEIFLYFAKLVQCNGLAYCTKYMKLSIFVIVKFLSGVPLSHTWDLGLPIKISHGLPAFLPSSWRSRIRGRDTNFIRIVISLLFSYRAYHVPMKPLPRIDSILATVSERASSSDFIYSVFRRYVKIWMNRFLAVKKVWSTEDVIPASYPYLTSSGPNSPISGMGLAADAYLHACDFSTNTESPVRKWLATLGMDHFVEMIQDAAMEFSKGLSTGINITVPKVSPKLLRNNPLKYGEEDLLNGTRSFWPNSVEQGLCFGKLHFLNEPAGKVRVIATADSIRQWLLKPIHDLIYDLLRKLPADGTFNQDRSVWDFALLGNKKIYSFDLSAATDMIPVHLYRVVMEPLLGEPLCSLWKDMMVSYPFELTKTCKVGSDVYVAGSPVKYNRGQPMGMLSSWAALALLHNMLVQFAAFYSFFKNDIDKLESNPDFDVLINSYFRKQESSIFHYTNYRIVGDDIVIGDECVADAYRILCDKLCIPLSEIKSITSERGVFTFVNQIFINDVNVSPASLQQELSVVASSQRFLFGTKLFLRGWSDSTTHIFTPMTLVRLVCDKRLFVQVSESVSKNRNVHLISRAVITLSLISESLISQSLIPKISVAMNGWLRAIFEHFYPTRLLTRNISDISAVVLRTMFRVMRQLLFDELWRIRFLLVPLKDAQMKSFMETKVTRFNRERLPPKLELLLGSMSLKGHSRYPAHLLSPKCLEACNKITELLAVSDVTESWINDSMKLLLWSLKIEQNYSIEDYDNHPFAFMVLTRLRQESIRIRERDQDRTNYNLVDTNLMRLLDTVLSKRYHNIFRAADLFDTNVYGLVLRPNR